MVDRVTTMWDGGAGELEGVASIGHHLDQEKEGYGLDWKRANCEEYETRKEIRV